MPGAVQRTAPFAASKAMRAVPSVAVEALDARTGRSAWHRDLAGAVGQPLRAGGLLYTDGSVLDAATGATVTPGTAFAGHQVVTGGRLYAVNGPVLACFAP